MLFEKHFKAFQESFDHLYRNGDVRLSGLSDSALSFWAAGLSVLSGKNTLLVVKKEKDFSKWSGAIAGFTGRHPLIFPSDHTVRQIDTIEKIVKNHASLVVVTPDTLREKVISPSEFRENALTVDCGKPLYSSILDTLSTGGYARADIVAEPGDFARRGEIIDFWPPDSEHPLRIVFRGDMVEKIKLFDAVSQRSLSERETAEIVPASYPDDSNSALCDFMGAGFNAVLEDDDYGGQIKELRGFLNGSGAVTARRVSLESSDFEYSTRPVKCLKSFEEVRGELDFLRDRKYAVYAGAPSESEIEKFRQFLQDEAGLSAVGFRSLMEEGFIVDEAGLAVISIADLFVSRRGMISRPEPLHPRPVEEFSDLTPGDYVIHRKFGVGEYAGIRQMNHGAAVSDFIMLNYASGGKLYVAVENADIIQKYIGSRWNTRLNSLSGKAWQKTERRIRKSVRELSRRLLSVYRKGIRKGFSFDPQPDMEKEFADAFPYRLTNHQERAVKDTLKDMESDYAMDRLICGDVGYGKTEVAMRAAFRAAVNGRQTVLLAPTTVLARQHFNTFRRRFSDFPVIIEMLSRLVPAAEQKRIIEKINSGKTDIIIGTHRLLAENIKYPALGLIIIDEEQRFGVEQKEDLRFRFPGAGLLTTTATPIPRTLSMAMGKIKGMSLINTPPQGRTAVSTRTMPFSMDIVKTAVRKELDRGGQVFFVHSRVGSIKSVTKMLKENIPEASFGYIHGRMESSRIDGIMTDFIEGKTDCLVATTIIENGLDIPNVNTIIIDHAHRLGLSDIYQLRGRVGRSSLKAYCYLLYPPELDFSQQVRERLAALTSFSALGSGFQLALRDLQIRGAGDILGPEQHGNIMKVGFDYYSSILREEIALLEGEEYIEPVDVEIDIPVSAYIPRNYIDSADLRLAFYRRISSVRSEDETGEIRKELRDRFGRIPLELENLIKIVELKIAAAEATVKKLAVTKNILTLIFSTGEKIERDITGENIFNQVKQELERIRAAIESR